MAVLTVGERLSLSIPGVAVGVRVQWDLPWGSYNPGMETTPPFLLIEQATKQKPTPIANEVTIRAVAPGWGFVRAWVGNVSRTKQRVDFQVEVIAAGKKKPAEPLVIVATRPK